MPCLEDEVREMHAAQRLLNPLYRLQAINYLWDAGYWRIHRPTDARTAICVFSYTEEAGG